MEDSFNTSVNKSSNNTTDNSTKGIDTGNVVTCIIISIGLPLTLVAIYGLYSQARKDRVAPIYIINLLISDTIQLVTLIVFVSKPEDEIINEIVRFICYVGLMLSVFFMTCVALERYLVIACPLWYRCRRNIKTSVVVSVVAWVSFLVFGFVIYFTKSFDYREVIYAALLLLTLPLLIFSLCGTVKALSAAISVPPDEKRRIVAILVLVLLIYTLLFLPIIICFLVGEKRIDPTFWSVCNLLPRFSPLADLFLYVFSRKGAVDQVLASVCHCRMNSDSDIREITT